MIYTIEKIPAPIPSNIKGYLTNDTHSVLSFVHHRVSKAHTILTQTSQIFLLKVTLENIPLSPPTRLIFNLGLSNVAGLGGGIFIRKCLDLRLWTRQKRGERGCPAWPGLERDAVQCGWWRQRKQKIFIDHRENFLFSAPLHSPNVC